MTTIVIPWSMRLTANERLHWRAKAAKVKAIRDFVRMSADNRAVNTLEVWLDIFPPDKRKRDADNFVWTLKPCCDGLVSAGLVPDDTPHFMVKHMPTIHEVDKVNPRIELTYLAAS